MYYSKDRKYVCITYPGAKNYILGDIQRKDFATRFLGKGMNLVTHGHENQIAPKWKLVLDGVLADNPMLEIE